MPVIYVDNVGEVGIVKDVEPYKLPPNVWSDGNNVRMDNRGVRSSYGHSAFWSDPQVAPYKLFPIQSANAYYWLYCGLNKVYAAQSQWHHDITRASGDYSANAYLSWTADNLNGIPVLNNGSDVPQYWDYPLDHSNKLQDLTGWPATDRCRLIRAFKNFLVAFNITRSGTQYPTLVKWSHIANLGSVPTSWDETDPTLDAGENNLPHGGGDILDARILRDALLIYRANSTWAMSFIGAPAIFRFWSIFDSSGILSRDCVREFYGRHFVVTRDDVIVHDGQQIQSVIDSTNRDFFFNDIGSDNYDKVFVSHYQGDKSMWICYPTGSGECNKALVWNYGDNTWAFRDLPGVTDIQYGVADEDARDSWNLPQGTWAAQTTEWASSSESWSLSDIAWDADDRPWDERAYDPQLLNLVYADPDDTKLWLGDSTNTENGTAKTSYVERTGLGLIAEGKTDHFLRKHVRSIYPHVDGTSGGVLNVYCGYQDYTETSVTWSAAQQFIIGQDYKVDFNVDGRLIAVRFESDTDVYWRLSGYQIDLEVSGER